MRNFVFLLLVFVYLVTPLYAGTIEDSRHVFMDNRSDSTNTAYFTFLGDFGIKKAEMDAFDDDSREELKILMHYLKSKSKIIGNYEIIFQDEYKFVLDFMRNNGFYALAFANNHTGDNTEAVNREVYSYTDSLGIRAFGLDDKPWIEFVDHGQIVRVLNAAGNIDYHTDLPCSVYEKGFSKILEEVLSDGDIHIFYAHLGGTSEYLEKYDVDESKKYLDMGFDAVIFQAPHITKGYYFQPEKIAVISPGDYLFPTSPRDEGYSPTTIPILGFENGKCVYYEIIVIKGTLETGFELADVRMRDEMVTLMIEHSSLDFSKTYSNSDSTPLFLDRVKKLLSGQHFDKIRPHHIKYAFYYVYYNYMIYIVLAVLLFFAIIFYRSYKKKQGKMSPKL